MKPIARRMHLLISLAVATAAFAHAATFEELSASAAAARDANNVPHAIELYRQALTANPQWKEGWWFLGTLLYDSDQYGPAKAALTNLVKLEPQAIPGWALLGLSEYQTGDYGPALEHVERSLAAGTNGDALPGQMQAVVRFHEALLLTRNGQFDAAMQRYAGFARVAPPKPPLLEGIGLAALRRPLLPKEVATNQHDLFIAAGTATYLTLTQNYAKAGESLQDLVNRFPTAAGVHYLYGTYLLASAPDHAAAQLQEELKIAPSNTAAAYMLAWVLLNQHDPAAALFYAKTAAATQPAPPTAEYVLGRALAETGDVQHGIEHLETASKLDPTNLENHLALASAYSKAGRTQDARRERDRSIQISKGNLVAKQ